MADTAEDIANGALLKIGDTEGLLDPGALTTKDSNQSRVLALLYEQHRDILLRGFKWPWAQRRAYPTQLGGAAYDPTVPYALGAMVSYAPAAANVVNLPESISTFVYVSLVDANLGHQPDISAGSWRQISRAAWAYAFVLPADVLQIDDLYRAGLRNPREDQRVPFELGYEPSPGPGTMLFTDAGLPWQSLNSATPVSIEVAYTAQVVDVKQFPPDFVEALEWELASHLCLALRKDSAEAKRCDDAAKIAIGVAHANALQNVRAEQAPMPSWLAARHTRHRRSG